MPGGQKNRLRFVNTYRSARLPQLLRARATPRRTTEN
jgi:hypothetical protein